VNALEAARRAGLRVRVEPLGAWGATPLLAEYDAARRTIAVDAVAVERLRVARGAAFARRFVECAVWHELYHHEHPGADEAAAHAFARRRGGDDPHAFAAALRTEGAEGAAMAAEGPQWDCGLQPEDGR
jgi:hypothetical protein